MDAETVKYCDVLLPPAFWCEKRGTYGCSERRYSLLMKSVEPMGECKSDFEILMDFAKRMDVDPKVIPFKEVDDVWNEWREVSSVTPYNFMGITRARMEKLPVSSGHVQRKIIREPRFATFVVRILIFQRTTKINIILW